MTDTWKATLQSAIDNIKEAIELLESAKSMAPTPDDVIAMYIYKDELKNFMSGNYDHSGLQKYVERQK